MRRTLLAHSVDRVIQRYVTIGERLCGSPSLDIVADSGQRCACCEVGQRHEKDGEREAFCGSCGKPWRGKTVHLMRGEVRVAARPGSGETRTVLLIDRWMPVRAIVETCPSGAKQRAWDHAVAAYIAWLDPDIRSLGAVVRWGERFRPRVRWSIGGVVRRIVWVRRVILKRLQGGVVVEELGERELVGPVEGARILGLRDPTGTGRRGALRLMKRGKIAQARNYGIGTRRGRWMAPRWAWQLFGGQREEPPSNAYVSEEGR